MKRVVKCFIFVLAITLVLSSCGKGQESFRAYNDDDFHSAVVFNCGFCFIADPSMQENERKWDPAFLWVGDNDLKERKELTSFDSKIYEHYLDAFLFSKDEKSLATKTTFVSNEIYGGKISGHYFNVKVTNTDNLNDAFSSFEKGDEIYIFLYTKENAVAINMNVALINYSRSLASQMSSTDTTTQEITTEQAEDSEQFVSYYDLTESFSNGEKISIVKCNKDEFEFNVLLVSYSHFEFGDGYLSTNCDVYYLKDFENGDFAKAKCKLVGNLKTNTTSGNVKTDGQCLYIATHDNVVKCWCDKDHNFISSTTDDFDSYNSANDVIFNMDR